MSIQKKVAGRVAKTKRTEGGVPPRFSPAIVKLARANLKMFESQSDESFLIRADMNRKLDSL